MTTYHDKDNQDDLHRAIENNWPSIDGKLMEDDIDQIIAEVCGESDGANWYWVISTKSGLYALLSGGCDYTGWDCQSHLHVDYVNSDPTNGALTAAGRAPEKDDYGRKIRQTLIDQVEGKQPFALYTKHRDE